MSEIKSMIIYMDNSCEVQFGSVDDSTAGEEPSSKILLSPCGSEFLHRSYATDNTIQTSLKYRTAYPISSLASKIRRVLTERNRHCNNKPFISPSLVESDKKSFWTSAENITHVKWKLKEPSIPIELDRSRLFYTWKSICGRAEIKIHLNKKLAVASYPIRVPATPAADEFSQLETQVLKNHDHQSKYLHKYTTNEQEFSMNHLPHAWSKAFTAMLELIENNKTQSDREEHVTVELPEAMPLSCNFTHMHKFDNIDTLSEPKIVYLNQTWFKLFYNTKSVEIFCPEARKETPLGESSTDSCQDYYVSDVSSGRFYTSYSVNKSKPDNVEEIKLCLDNLPSFKIHTKRVLSYASILMRRVDSVQQISNYASCFTLKKIEDIESSRSADPNLSNTSRVKSQAVVENVGHFKLFNEQSILINFADRAKIYMDRRSVEAWIKKEWSKCFISLYLPDYSEHEICISNRSNLSDQFKNYLSFLDQWIDWLQKEQIL